VNAYGVYRHITFPLIVKIFKPKGTLKSSDKYQTKIELASEIITELIDAGFNIEVVLADSLDGESSQFIGKLDECCGREYSHPQTLAEYNLFIDEVQSVN